MNDITTPPPPTDAPAGNGKRRRIMGMLIAGFLLLGIGWALLQVLVWSKREKTDDAYVSGNQVRVSSQVGGTIVEVFARNTSRVSAGQVLARLDPTDAQQALDGAEAALAQSVRQVRQRTAETGGLDALIEARALELKRAQDDLARREPLLADKAVSAEEVMHLRDTVAMARAQLQQARGQGSASHALVDGLPIRQNPLVNQQRTAYRDAWLALKRTAIVAPVSGYVVQRSVQLGQHISPGEPLMTVIPLQDLWLDANFKESQLRNLRIGQKAEIVTDQYGGGVVYHGHVTGLLAGTGAAFSLLPPQNASGNWIKVVQRVPVKIALDPKELAEHPLRIGLSTTATVDTRDHSGAVLAPEDVSDVNETTSAYGADLAAADAAAEAIIVRHAAGS
jgi:membrane fusion protein, multidrug efflux system